MKHVSIGAWVKALMVVYADQNACIGDISRMSQGSYDAIPLHIVAEAARKGSTGHAPHTLL